MVIDSRLRSRSGTAAAIAFVFSLCTVGGGLAGCSDSAVESGTNDGDGGVGPDADPGPLAVNVGPDQTINEPLDHVSLIAVITGSRSDGATVVWTQTAGATTTLEGADTTALAVSGLTVGSYTFRATASNAAGDEAFDEVTVTVASNATLCLGATYHVSPSGSDESGDGSEGAPWATLAHATSQVTTAGSMIRLDAGSYLETARSELAPGVCIEGAGPSTVITSTLTEDWTPIIHATSPEGTDGHQHIAYLKLDGQNLSTFWAIEVAGRSNFSIHDVVVVDFKDRGVIFNGRADNLAEAPTVWATGLSFYNNTILNSAAYDTPNGVYGRGCLNVGGTEGMLIYNNVITQDQRPIGQNGWPIKGSNDGHNKGLKIFNNTLTKIPFTGAFGGDQGWDFAVEMFFDQGTEFYGNTVIGAGFDTNQQSKGDYPYSVWIHDNTFTLPEIVNANNVAVTLEFNTDGAIVENNVINRFSNCVLFTPRDGNTISNVTIAGNLCTNVSKGAGNGSNASFINVGPGGQNFNVNGLYIYNNTFISDPDNRPWWGIELGGAAEGSTTNVEIKNNIIAYTVSGAIVQGGGVVMGRVEITHNDIYDIEATTDPVWTSSPPTDYVYESNIHVDPLFVSATDFTLRDGSPAIDSGVDVGRPYSGAAPDIGYAER